VDGDASGFETDRDLGQLFLDVIAVRVFHANDRDAVRFTVNDDEARLIGGQCNGGRTAWSGECHRIGCVMEQATQEY
jgi:hypothetical protein